MLIPVEQSRLEKNETYTDRWPCLNLRKFLLKIKIMINLTAQKVDQHKAFEYASIIVILLNCVQMAYEGPSKEEPSRMMETIEHIFLALYTVELIIKIVAKGFILNQGAYLRDTFNVLDFIIVLSAYLTLWQTLNKDETRVRDQ